MDIPIWEKNCFDIILTVGHLNNKMTNCFFLALNVSNLMVKVYKWLDSRNCLQMIRKYMSTLRKWLIRSCIFLIDTQRDVCTRETDIL